MSEQPVVFDDDNPEWTDEDFARARPITDFPDLMAAFPRSREIVGKKVISIAVDDEVLDRYRSHGADWQKDMNDALRKAVGL